MTDIAHLFGSDISLDASGDLTTASMSAATRLRVIRRLLTNPRAYVWHGDYGGGLPGQVGGFLPVGHLQGIVSEQMALEAAVDQSQPITVSVRSDNIGDESVSVTYTDAQDGTVQTALVPISG